MKNVAFVTILFIMILPALDATGSEWKFFGGSTFPDEKMINFYDAESLKYLSNGTIQVWIEAIGQSEFNNKMTTNEKDIIEKSAKKVVNGYSPPYSLVTDKTSYEDSIDLISWEELANHSVLQARTKMLFEINCNENQIRTLTATIFEDNGNIKKSKKLTGEWDYISPDSNAETLKKILCK
jgi:hypothetical protein